MKEPKLDHLTAIAAGAVIIAAIIAFAAGLAIAWVMDLWEPAR